MKNKLHTCTVTLYIVRENIEAIPCANRTITVAFCGPTIQFSSHKASWETTHTRIVSGHSIVAKYSSHLNSMLFQPN